MRRSHHLLLILWTIHCLTVAVRAEPLAGQPTTEQLQQWAKQLDAVRAAERNRAMRMLLRHESAASLPFLLNAIRESSPEGSARAVGVLQEFALSDSAELSDAAFGTLREASQLRHSGAPARQALEEFSVRLLARLKPRIDGAGGTLTTDSRGGVEVVIGSAWRGEPRDLTLLAKLNHIKRMSLERCPLTDADMAHLRGIRVGTLYLGETKISRRGLETLGKMETVTYLSLKRNRLLGLTPESLALFPNVTHLGLDETDVNDEDLRALRSTPNIETLWLNETQVSDQGLAHLSSLEGLRTLYLTGTQVTGSGLKHIRELPLVYLSLKETPISEAGLEAVSHLTSLTTLGLDHTTVQDAQLRHVSKLNNLHVLWLSKSRVTDEGMRHLTGLRGLQRVYVHGAPVTDAGRRLLFKAIPGCRVEGVMTRPPPRPEEPGSG